MSHAHIVGAITNKNKIMSIYEKVYEEVAQGAAFRIDFKSRTLTVNGKKVIDNGNHKGILGMTWDWDIVPVNNFLAEMGDIFQDYKHSIPSEQSDRNRRCYFKALPEKELSDEDMMYGMPRELARFLLEFRLLSAILDGFQWDEAKMGKWFWQSEDDKDFVILREWVDGE